ncbi:MAG TPA: hypothetical protein VGI39_46115 [Polyangiaceae bacterium]
MNERRSVLFRRGWRAALVASALGSLGFVHATLMAHKTYANVDEAYAMALASRLLDGKELYVGAVSQRGPLMYYLYEAIAWLHGWDAILALRWWSFAFDALHVLLTFVLGWALLSADVGAIAAAVVGYALALGLPALDGLALHGESLQLPFLLVGALAVPLATRRWRPGPARSMALAAAGLSLGLAFAIKQAVIVPIAIAVAWLGVDARRRHTPKGLQVSQLAAFGLGALAPPAFFVAHAWHAGSLGALYYYTVVYNRDVHMAPLPSGNPWEGPLAYWIPRQTIGYALVAALAGVSAWRTFVRFRTWRERRTLAGLTRGLGPHSYVAAQLFATLLSGAVLMRFFPHYFVPAIPFLGLAIGLAARPLLQRRALEWPVRAAMGAFFVASVTFARFSALADDWNGGRVEHGEAVQKVASYVEATTQPSDRIFVWGFSPWIYGYAHRRPAARFAFMTYVTGFVPWYWLPADVERKRVVPGAMEGLIEDLERETPAVIVDAGAVLLGRSMRSFEPTYALLRRRYCFEARIGLNDVYRRVDEGAPCTRAAWPTVSVIEDAKGVVLDVPFPPTLDEKTSRPLPLTARPTPVWFCDAPPPPVGLARLGAALDDDAACAPRGSPPEE